MFKLCFFFSVELEEEMAQSLQSRLMVMEERARIAEEEIKEISSKKIDVSKKINEMRTTRVLIEYELRSEQCNLLEMNISALDADGDHCGFLEPFEEKIKSLKKKIDVIDRELNALKEEEKSLDEDLENALGSHFVVI